MILKAILTKVSSYRKLILVSALIVNIFWMNQRETLKNIITESFSETLLTLKVSNSHNDQLQNFVPKKTIIIFKQLLLQINNN